ncbi:MOSC domain-containing protein [Paraliomyxa miuraensis]|uniref:MOSC domain-containing protein n=1 Tax=Paraliomyxa miuraensis TaxID=376150 RepID=UPI00224E86BE|nr:MOSC N-terminal beta barrel domain-containing protein [Paraliomyxa miuraensis]MCX4245316.1 MOSC domain-containing protein [Paraliomyxa miuraensis]
MKLSAIHVYPIKSLRGVSVRAARTRVGGLEHDRRWMLVDEAGTFVTQREDPALARLTVGLFDGGIRVGATGEAIEIPLQHDGPRVGVRVWRSSLEAIEHEAGSAFFSRYLRRPLRLVYQPADALRVVQDSTRPGDRVSLADSEALLLVGQGSIDGLNERVREPALPVTRFRPNLVVEGAPPHAEDAWATVRIGAIGLRGVGRCSRCVMTTLDPLSGDKGVEPLRTLAEYRREHGKVWFGAYFVADDHGWLRVGDEVVVSTHTDPG